MRYRADIEGLRAVAVLPVILYHAGFGLFSGGYIGVDVFFVISGYLITSLIVADLEKGDFRLSHFYERRARRILPALIPVMLASMPLSWLWLVPIDTANYAKSLIAVSTFSSNFLFWLESGYFQRAAELKPLLHTWSLAVEEQYYILFPLIVLGLWRRHSRRLICALGVFAVLSLMVSQWASHARPEFNFYSLVTRAWEIFSGAILALYLRRQEPRALSLRRCSVLSLVGLGLIAIGIFGFDHKTPVPGLYSVIPVLGTVMVLACSDPRTRAYRLLASPPMVFIGSISYGAYLWHQPLLAFAKYQFWQDPPRSLMLLLAALSLVLGYLSKQYIERPFRDASVISAARFKRLTLGALLILTAAGVYGVVDGGNLRRFDPALLAKIEAARTSENDRVSECRPFSDQPYNFPSDRCWYGSGSRKILIWGDSHNDNISRVFPEFLADTRVYHAAYAWCAPIFGIHRVDRPYPACVEFNQRVLEWAASQDFDAIILGGRWRMYAESRKFDNGEGGIEDYSVVFAADDWDGAEQNRKAGVLSAYKSSIEKIADRFATIPVFLIYQVPEAGWNVPDLYLRYTAKHRRAGMLSTRYDVYVERNRDSKAVLDSVASSNIHRLYPDKIFCNKMLEGRCIVADGDRILYRDDDHVTLDGARILVREYADAVNSALAK